MIRLAEPKDASEAIDLVMIVLKDMELEVFNKLPEEKITELLITKKKEKSTYRYGFKNALIKEVDNKIADVVFGYPDHFEATIDNEFIDLLIENNLSEDYQFFNKEEVETFKNEWYLDTLVTSPQFRGKGIARELLDALPTIAKEKNCPTIGLNVDKVNSNARRIYLNNGFEKTGELDISNHRYDHLQKSVG